MLVCEIWYYLAIVTTFSRERDTTRSNTHLLDEGFMICCMQSLRILTAWPEAQYSSNTLCLGEAMTLPEFRPELS